MHGWSSDPAPALLLPAAALADDLPESRALAYLAREVPRWSAENHCFSCHNNGDAARARTRRSASAGRRARGDADTDRWLARPEGWDRNGGDGPISDKALARVQFTAGARVGRRVGPRRATGTPGPGRRAAGRGPGRGRLLADRRAGPRRLARDLRPAARHLGRPRALRSADPPGSATGSAGPTPGSAARRS